MALSIVHIGNDNTLAQLLKIPSYYSDLALAVAGTYLVGWYMKDFFTRMHRKFGTDTSGKNRIVHHALFGLVLPAAFVMALELIYLFTIGIDWKTSSIFYLELPLVILYLVIINLVYSMLYFQKKESITHEAASDRRENQQYRDTSDFVIASTGTRNFNIPQKEIAYFFSKDKISFVICHGSDNRKYIHDQTLKELAGQLPKADFFQLNRQIIATRSSILNFTQTPTRRIQVQLTPPYDGKVYISKTRAAAFLQWIRQD
jgi:hypothetical protein